MIVKIEKILHKEPGKIQLVFLCILYKLQRGDLMNSKIFLILSGILIAVIAFIAAFKGLLPSYIAVPAVILYILFIVHIDND